MFRAQANQFDEVVAKATDENLTQEDWSRILDVCDRVSASPTGPSSAVAALIKRLAHRNANVQLYTLELANALSQNCGDPIHRELSSRSFTDALIRLASDRNAHPQVKSKVLERMAEWTEQFKGNPDLGIMEGAYDKLRRANPTLQPPSKPVKSAMKDEDRRKEEEELQMALELSLKDKEPVKKGEPATSSQEESSTSEAAPQQPQGTTAATISRVRALYDFSPSEPGELAFRKGDVIAVLESVYKDWWKGSLRGQTGIFPLNYVEKLQDPTREELEKDATMEGEVFAQIRNVEKLLALLSVRGEGGFGGKDSGTEEEITELYNETLAIRPKLIELIGKYSQKKDDFTQLNEKFIKARRDYEALLETSMSQPQGGYGYPGGRPPLQPQYHNSYGQPPQGYPPQHYPQQRPPQQHYPQQTGPPPHQQQQFYPPQPQAQAESYAHVNGAGHPPSSAFHFLPDGVPQAQQSQTDPRNATPKPHVPSAGASVQPPFSPQPSQFNARPQSVYTLNSGNPSELATPGYESPADIRHGHPPAPQAYQQQQQPGYSPEQQQQPQHKIYQHPSYPTAATGSTHHLPPQQQQQQSHAPPPQDSGAPPSDYAYPQQPQHAPPPMPTEQPSQQQQQQQHQPQQQQLQLAPQQSQQAYTAYSPQMAASAAQQQRIPSPTQGQYQNLPPQQQQQQQQTGVTVPAPLVIGRRSLDTGSVPYGGAAPAAQQQQQQPAPYADSAVGEGDDASDYYR